VPPDPFTHLQEKQHQGGMKSMIVEKTEEKTAIDMAPLKIKKSNKELQQEADDLEKQMEREGIKLEILKELKGSM
jgi:hypothetical protein